MLTHALEAHGVGLDVALEEVGAAHGERGYLADGCIASRVALLLIVEDGAIDGVGLGEPSGGELPVDGELLAFVGHHVVDVLGGVDVGFDEVGAQQREAAFALVVGILLAGEQQWGEQRQDGCTQWGLRHWAASWFLSGLAYMMSMRSRRKASSLLGRSMRASRLSR